MHDIATLPDGLDVRVLKVRCGSEYLDWWRVEDEAGAILGSGFDMHEAIENSWNEVLRRRAGT